MRRALITAALLVVVAALPLWAQRRGGVGFARRGAVGFRPGGHIGVRPGVGFRGGVAFGHHSGVRLFIGSRRPVFRHRFFFNPFFSYPYGYTLYPYYGLGLQSDLIYSGYPSQPAYDYSAEQTAALSNDVSRLQAELDEIRQLQALREQQQYAAPAPTPRPAPAALSAASSEPAGPPTVLVFKDGHRSEVRNYAVVGQTLWIFTEQRARKVPLGDVNLDATRSANEERGVEFAVRANPPALSR